MSDRQVDRQRVCVSIPFVYMHIVICNKKFISLLAISISLIGRGALYRSSRVAALSICSWNFSYSLWRSLVMFTHTWYHAANDDQQPLQLRSGSSDLHIRPHCLTRFGCESIYVKTDCVGVVGSITICRHNTIYCDRWVKRLSIQHLRCKPYANLMVAPRCCRRRLFCCWGTAGMVVWYTILL